MGRDAEWQALLDKPLFKRASDGDNGSLNFLVKNYVERMHLLWKVLADFVPPSSLPADA